MTAESYPEHFDKLEGWLSGRELKNGKSWNIKPREIRLYDLVIPHEAEAEVLSLLKPLNNRRHLRLFQKIIKFAYLPFRKFMRPIDNNVTGVEFKEQGWWAYVTPVCKINDDIIKGKEMI